MIDEEELFSRIYTFCVNTIDDVNILMVIFLVETYSICNRLSLSIYCSNQYPLCTFSGVNLSTTQYHWNMKTKLAGEILRFKTKQL